MIIDVRCRLTTIQGGKYFYTQAKNLGTLDKISAMQEDTVEAFFKDISGAGITTAVSVSGNNPGLKIGSWDLPDRTTPNKMMADLQKQYYGKFIGVAGIDTGNRFHEAVREIESCHAMGLRSVFIEPGRSPGCNLDDPRLFPIYQKCQDLNMTLIPQTSGPFGGASVDYANPKHIERVAANFPRLRILLGHGCYPYVREAIVMTNRHSNVWISPDIYLFHLGTEDWLKAVNENLFGFEDKFVFGSAYPVVLIKPFVERFLSLPWRKDVLPKILYRNALKALELENDPVFRTAYKL